MFRGNRQTSFDWFKSTIRNKGGIWASEDVYFAQFRDGYGASYRPNYPGVSGEDCAWTYNAFTDSWRYTPPEEYRAQYNAIGKGMKIYAFSAESGLGFVKAYFTVNDKRGSSLVCSQDGKLFVSTGSKITHDFQRHDFSAEQAAAYHAFCKGANNSVDYPEAIV